MGYFGYVICAYCGHSFLGTQNKLYCSDECKATAKMIRMRQRAKDRRVRARTEMDRIAHQVDPTVWCHDYAEKQKQDTLNKYGRINVDEYKVHGNASTSRKSD